MALRRRTDADDVRVNVQNFVTAVAILGFSTTIYLFTHELPPMGWPDYAGFAVWILLLGWCLSPARLLDADSHEGAGNGIAFRCGKALKRILHHRSRNTAPRD